MWTAKNRGRYDRSKLRYPSDLTDDEWVSGKIAMTGAVRRATPKAFLRPDARSWSQGPFMFGSAVEYGNPDDKERGWRSTASFVWSMRSSGIGTTQRKVVGVRARWVSSRRHRRRATSLSTRGAASRCILVSRTSWPAAVSFAEPAEPQDGGSELGSRYRPRNTGAARHSRHNSTFEQAVDVQPFALALPQLRAIADATRAQPGAISSAPAAAGARSPRAPRPSS